jgi:hypothetical protein
MQPSFEEQLKQWRVLELEALNAEARLKETHAANTPETRNAALDAAEKRKRADEFLDTILGITRGKPAA